ncbi:MAG: hypothetical protein ACTHKV_08490 [Flavipsychrobacter sp.]
MLEIKIGNEDLDLLPGTQLEIERENPFVQFDDKVVGEFSLPFTVPASPKNLRLLNYAGLLQARHNSSGVDAIVYDNGVQHSIGKVKIEKANIQLNRGDRGTISCYYLTGISRFYQEIKDKRLRDIDMGGDRTFSWDNYARNGSGFWGHIHKVIDAPAGYGSSGYDYAFYPVANDDFTWTASTTTIESGVINNMQYGGGTVNFTHTGADNRDANIITPFPYLKYVLERIAAYIGWQFQGDVLNDPQFLKITLENNRAIDWAYYIPARIVILGNDGYKPKPSVSFNLSNHLPDVTISEFLLALRNRFGWFLDIDKKGKILRIKNIQGIANSVIKDFSYQVNPVLVKTIRTETKIYSLATSQDSGAINLSGVAYQGDLTLKTELPAASEARYLHVYLVITENNYYICQQKDDAANVYEWQLYDYNIRDVIPDGTTDTIKTSALTTGVEKYNDYLDLIPRWDEEGFWPGRNDEFGGSTIMLLFYYGLRQNKAGQPFPFASSHIYDSRGQQVGDWSLSFLGKKSDGTDVGIYALYFKKFLDTLTSTEELEVVLNLSLIDYLQLGFTDIISINNVRMYALKLKSSLPYKQQLTAECSRVG